MKKGTNGLSKSYFAAANGYTGFRSYFREIFDSENFDRIFVLKGGPGTGKSSFMKTIEQRFSDIDADVEKIICSSDPNSLDGVIIKTKASAVAVLDGTAPHERDATVPGAIDEIINLGCNWNERWLIGKRDAILDLSKQKQSAYEAAYAYLKTAGFAHGYEKKLIASHFNSKKIKYQAKSLAEKYITENGRTKTRLISSFGKHGIFNLDTLNTVSDSIIGVLGSASAAQAFLKNLYGELDGNVDVTLFPNALDPESIDAVLIDSARLAIVAEKRDDNIVLDSENSVYDAERARVMSTVREAALNEARRWFGIASDLHFKLEEIYGEAMNFDKNTELCDQTVEKISIVLKS